MDCREKLLNEFSNDLITKGMDPNQVKAVSDVLLMRLKDYSVDTMSTALSVNLDRNSALIRAFVATGLTEGKSKRTAQAYKYFLDRFSREIGIPLEEVQTIHIRLWLAEKEQKVSLATCENCRAYLSAFYTWMLSEDYITKNPMLKIKPIKVEEKVKLPFSSVEIDALRTACGSTRDRAIFETLISSGVRVSELCALNVSDIDFTSRRVIVRSGKGGKGRTTFISEVAQKYLQEYLGSRKNDDEALIITRNDTRITTSAVEKLMKNLGKTANVSNTHPHRCRRTFATDLARRGMNVQEIKLLMGHSDINTTMIYCYLDNKSVEFSYKRCG